MHPQAIKVTRGPRGPYRRKPLEQRFWPKVNKNGPTIRADLGPCWVWTGGTSKGYGVINAGGKYGTNIQAHRLSFAIANGGAWPEMVRHRCDNRPCVRPDHLEGGTHIDNMADMAARGRQSRGEAHTISRLTAAQVIAIRSRYVKRVVTYARLAAEYGVTASAIRQIIVRRNWAHVR